MTEAQSEQDPIVLYICKPESGSQGRGIFIATKVEEMRDAAVGRWFWKVSDAIAHTVNRLLPPPALKTD